MHRIVVIEDDPAIQRGLTTTLRLESYDVLVAARGDEGYRMVRDVQPDLVILDLMLPGMSGVDVCRQIRRHGLATPILMLTAQDQEARRVEGFEAGADDYVTKPFSLRELTGRVRAILRRSEGRSDLANQKELDEARRIQERLMPADIPQLPGVHIAAACRPARVAGGDYFDVLKLSDHAVAVCIADVCGKGMPAALIMASLQAAVKTCASAGMRPREVCETVNRLMCDSVGEGRFVSFFYAVIDGDGAGARRCIYCDAGHPPPILSRRQGGIGRLDCGGAVLGVLRRGGYDEQEVNLAPGDRILLFTDGATENLNQAGEEFGEERLLDLVRRSEQDGAVALVNQAMASASDFSGGWFDDDATVVAVSVECL